MNQTLTEFEHHIAMGPTFAARLLGVAYATYAQYRSGHRRLQVYHCRHIQALMLLTDEDLQNLITEHIHNDSSKKARKK